MPRGTATLAVGKSELRTSSTVAALDRSPELVGTAEQDRRGRTTSPAASSSRILVDETGTPWRCPPRAPDRRRRTRFVRPSRSSSSTLPCASVPKVEVRAHHDEPVRRAHRRGPRSRNPRLARWPGPRRSGTTTVRSTRRCQQLELLLEVGQDGGADSGRTTVAGWRSKVTTTLASLARRGLAPKFAQDVGGRGGHRRRRRWSRLASGGRRAVLGSGDHLHGSGGYRALFAALEHAGGHDAIRSSRRLVDGQQAPARRARAHGPSPAAPTDTRSSGSPWETAVPSRRRPRSAAGPAAPWAE